MTARRLPSTVMAACALHAVFFCVGWVIPPSLNSDSATGFQVWDSWRNGGAWNHLTMVDPSDITRDAHPFQAWWSPGQYLIAAPFQCLGLSLGHAIDLGTFVTALIALYGYWRLFRSFDFDPSTAGWAVLAISCNWTLTRTYGYFMGGEPALLAALPWLVMATRRVLAAGRWVPWLLIPALYWLGSMAKLAYVPMAAGLLAGFRGPRLWRRPAIAWAKLGEVAQWIAWIALGQLILWWTYLRLGANPMSARGGSEISVAWWKAVLQILSFPVSSALSLGSLLSRILLYPLHPVFANLHDLWGLNALLAAGGVALEVWILRREFRTRLPFAWMLLGVVAAYTGFFVLLLALGTATGLEDRYFKPVGFLLIPGMVALARARRPRFASAVVACALAAASLYGISAAFNRTRYLAAVDNPGKRGITQHVISREGLQILHQIDAELPAGSLIVVPSPEIAFDVRRTRVLSTHAAMADVPVIETWHYRGRVGNLIVLANAAMAAAGQTEALLHAFQDYPMDRWTVHRYGEWSFYEQGSYSHWSR